MTNEEAKKMLKAKLECLKRETSGTDIDCNSRNCDECSLCYEQGNMGEQKEALDLAIKALEQQPCEDCISREEALKVMCDSCPMHNCVTGCSSYRHIEKMPSVTPQQTRWIPCSERMPEDEQEILFSTKTGRVYSGKYHDDDSANQWYSHRDKCRAWNNVVTAWMPLPQPYEADSQESEDEE